MKTIFYWRDIIGNNDLFAPYKKEIAQLAQAEYKSLLLERLQSSGTAPIYSIRVNKEERLLFTTYKGKLCLLDVVKNHDYHKSRFLRNPRVLKAFLAKLDLNDNDATDDIAELVPLTGSFEATDTVEGLESDSSNEPVELQALTQYRDRLIHFNNEQEHALSMKSPAVIYGPAGSGKTCVAISMLEQYIRTEKLSNDNTTQRPALYVSRSAPLVVEMKTAWERAVTNLELRNRVTFLTLDELFKQPGSTNKTWTDYDSFVQWYSSKKIKRSLTNISPKDLWLEFRNLSGNTTLNDYLALSHSCHFVSIEERPLVRTEIFNLYHSFTDYDHFEQWYCNRKRKDSLKSISPKDLWLEFRILSGYDSLSEYLALGQKQSCSFATKEERLLVRTDIFNLYKSYNELLFKEKTVINELNPPPPITRFSLVLVDEAQDCSYGQLRALEDYSMQSHAVFFLGDHQILFDGKSRLPFLRNIYFKKQLELSEQNLPKTYRCSKEVVAVANRLIKLKHHIVGGAADKVETASMAVSAESGQGQLRWFPTTDTAQLIEQAKSVSVAVITPPEYVEEARHVLNTPLVFTPEQIKGLEYDSIIVWKPFGIKQAQQANRKLLNDPLTADVSSNRPKSGQGDETLLPFFNELITAATRARKELTFVQDNAHQVQAMIDSIKPAFANANTFATPAVAATADDSTSLWEKEAKRLWAAENKEQARDVASSKLNLTGDELEAFFNPPIEQTLQDTPKAKTTNADAPKKKKKQAQALPQKQNNPQPVPSEAKKEPPKPAAISSSALNETQMTALLDNFLKTMGNATFLLKLINKNPETSTVFLKCLANNLKLLTELPLIHFGSQPEVKLNTVLKNGLDELNEIYLSINIVETKHIKDAISKGYTPSIVATQLGLPTALKALAKLGANLNQTTNKGFTVAHNAAQNGHCDILRFLNNQKIDLNQANKDGTTPAHVAAKNEQLQVLITLHELDVDLTQVDTNGFTPASMAASHGKNKSLRLLRELGVDLNNPASYDVTPALAAAQYGHSDTLRVLTELDVDINQATKNGFMPAHAAAEKGHCDVLRTLKKLGANLNQPDINGCTPACIAACRGQSEALKTLYELGADFHITLPSGATLAHLAAEFGHCDTLKLLRGFGVDLNLPDKNGSTPAWLAVLYNQEQVLETLIKLGIDVNQINIEGASLAHAAAISGNFALLRTLKKQGVNLNQTDNEGRTPAWIAAQLGHDKVLEALKELEVDLNQVNNEGSSLAHAAALHGSTATLRTLKKLDVNLNCANKDENSPLHFAAESENIDAIKYLCGRGANINQQNSDGVTPACFAAENNDIDTLSVLIQLGADLDLPSEGPTPSIVAAEYGCLEVFNYLIKMRPERLNTPILTDKCSLMNLAKTSQAIMIQLTESRVQVKLKERLDAGDTEDKIHLLPKDIAWIMGHQNIVNSISDLEKDQEMLALLEDFLSSKIENHDLFNIINKDVEASKVFLRCVANNNLKFLMKLPIRDFALKRKANESLKMGLQELDILRTSYIPTDKFMIEYLFKQGARPLFAIAKNGKPENIRILAALGADLDQTNNEGFTAAHVAAQTNQVSILKALKELGAKLDQGNNHGRTPAHLAASLGQLNVLSVLHELDVDLNKSDKLGGTPAFCAAQANQLIALVTLNGLGADLDLASSDGATPTFVAAQMGHLESFKFLIDNKPERLNTSICINQGALKKFAKERAEAHVGIEERLQTKINDRLEKGDNEDRITLSLKEVTWIIGDQEILKCIEDVEKAQSDKLAYNNARFFPSEEKVASPPLSSPANTFLRDL